MISIYAIEPIIRDLEDIIRLGNIPEEVVTALQYNVLGRLRYVVEEHYISRSEVLKTYLEDAADGEIEMNFECIDVDYWANKIEEYAFNDEATWEPAKEALKYLIEAGFVRYVESPDEMEDLA